MSSTLLFLQRKIPTCPFLSPHQQFSPSKASMISSISRRDPPEFFFRIFTSRHMLIPMENLRHSKICTAAGFRDRRMRLSLDVARKFFDLQDLLGFDKGSETVQWLLTNSRAAIDELTTASNGELHMSSELEDASPSVSDHAKGKSSTFEISSSTDDSMNKSKNKSSVKNKPKKKSSAKDKSKNTSSASKSQLQAKESRSQARARARERTREKKILMSSSLSEANRFGVAEEEDRQEDLKSLCFIDRDLSSKSHNKLASGSSTWLQLLNSATTTQQASMMQLACFKNNWA